MTQLLDMYSRAVRSMRGFANGLRHCRMPVNRSYQLFDCRLQPQCERRLSHELSGSQSDHVDAKHFVVLLVRNDLDEPFGLSRHLGTSQHAKRKRSDSDVVTTSLGLALGKAD